MLMRHVKRFNTKIVVYTFIDDHVVRNATDDRRVLQVDDATWWGRKPLFDASGRTVPSYLRKAPHRLADHALSAPRLWELLQIAWNRLGPRPGIPARRGAGAGDAARQRGERGGVPPYLLERPVEHDPVWVPRSSAFDEPGHSGHWC